MHNSGIKSILSKCLPIILVAGMICCGVTGCNIGGKKSDARQTDKSRFEDDSDDVGDFLMQLKEWKANALLNMYLSIEIDPNEYSLAAKKLFGTKLTDSDFTDSISVPGANRHCVVYEDDITLIYLEFPSSWETTEYWEYEMSLDYFDDWLSWNNDSQHCFMIRKDDTTQGFYRCGNVVISFAGGSGATDLQKKSDLFFKTLGCPTTEKVAELIEDNSASDAAT